MIIKENSIKLYNYLWDDNSKTAIINWLKLLISFKGMWVFLPALLGILVVYYAESHSLTKLLLDKSTNETIALWLMGITTGIFLIRVVLYKLAIDIILLAMAINFLCREIHFPGTSAGVYIVAILIILLSLFWKNRILENIKGATLFQAFLTATFILYLSAILIQRRVFKPHRLPFLPREDQMHIYLEEFMENLSHSFFLLAGVIAFFSISKLLCKNKSSEKQLK